MSKFDDELYKILLEQNLIDENWFTDGAQKTWNSVKSVGKKIIDTGKEVLNWSIDKIKAVFQKLWDLLTPDNAEETAEKSKKIVQKIPGQLGDNLRKSINITNSEEYQSFVSKKLNQKYTSADEFKRLSNSQQKQILANITQQYLKQDDKLISEAAITTAAAIFMCLKWLIIIGGGWLASTNIIKLFKGPSKEQQAKDQSAADQINRENEKKQIQHQKYLDQQQRKQLFQLVAQSNYFN